MKQEQAPLFLKRGSYRRRRLLDAVKLLAILGGVLWMIPVLWPKAADSGVDAVLMSGALYYIFGVWLLLIVLAAVISRKVDDQTTVPEAGEGDA